MEFLSNNWFVGIVGGIISALLFFPLNEYLGKLVNKKEYKKLIKEANSKISKILIMSISEGKIPSPNVIDALLSSSAKKNGVRLKDINTVQETYDDLVYELFDTIFISVENKQILANRLIEEKLSSQEQLFSDKTFAHSMNPEVFKESSFLEKKLAQNMSFILSMITTIAILGISSALLSIKGIDLFSIIDKGILEFTVSLIGTFVGVLALLNSISSAKSAGKAKEEIEIEVRRIKKK